MTVQTITQRATRVRDEKGATGVRVTPRDRVRQARITRELIEIISGAEAL